MRLISAVSGVQFSAPPFLDPSGVEFRKRPMAIKWYDISGSFPRERIPRCAFRQPFPSSRPETLITIILVAIILSLACLAPLPVSAAEKISRKPPPKETPVSDSTLQASMAKAADFLKKGNQDDALRMYSRVNGFSKEVLATVKIVRKQYDRLVNDPSTEQTRKEEMLIKLKRIDDLLGRYTAVRDTSGYYIGYLYAQKGDQEKARQYLAEVLASAPFGMERDSLWMKSKTLLLGLYDLEGEF
jgi:hypothetical protein